MTVEASTFTVLKVFLLGAVLLLSLLSASSTTTYCGGVHLLTAESPALTISSLGFDGNGGLDCPDRCWCQWTMIGPQSHKLLADFHAFNISQGNSCHTDKLLVDGSGSCDFEAPIMLCGDDLPQPISASGNIICLRFMSTSRLNRSHAVKFTVSVLNATSTTRSGHEANTNLTPSNDETGVSSATSCSEFPMIIRSNTTIMSPNFGHSRRYPPNTQCRWLVYVDTFHGSNLKVKERLDLDLPGMPHISTHYCSTQKAILRFQVMNLEYHSACIYDYVRLLEGEETNPTFELRFCGSALPLPVEITSPKILLFSSDHIIQYYGFLAVLEFHSLINSSSINGYKSISKSLSSHSDISSSFPTTLSSHTASLSSETFHTTLNTHSASLSSKNTTEFSSSARTPHSFGSSTRTVISELSLLASSSFLPSDSPSEYFLSLSPSERWQITSKSPVTNSIPISHQPLLSPSILIASTPVIPLATAGPSSSVAQIENTKTIKLQPKASKPLSLAPSEISPEMVTHSSSPLKVSPTFPSYLLESSDEKQYPSEFKSTDPTFHPTSLLQTKIGSDLSNSIITTSQPERDSQSLSVLDPTSLSRTSKVFEDVNIATLPTHNTAHSALYFESKFRLVPTSLSQMISASTAFLTQANNVNEQGYSLPHTPGHSDLINSLNVSGTIISNTSNNSQVNSTQIDTSDKVNSSLNYTGSQVNKSQYDTSSQATDTHNSTSNNVNDNELKSNSQADCLHFLSNNVSIDSTQALDIPSQEGNKPKKCNVIDICSRTTVDMTTLDLVIESPGFKDGKTYPPSTRCDLLVRAPSNKTIHGRMLSIDLEQHHCVWDWLEVTSRFKMVGRFCGTEKIYFQSEDIVLLTFNSDAVVNKAGFRLYLSLGDSPPPGSVDLKRELTMCSAPILSFVTEEEVLVTSPGYTLGSYPTLTECDLRLFTSEHNVLQVRVLDLELEDHPACSYDYVNLRDGVSTSAAALARMCGTAHVQPPTLSGHTIVTSGASLWIHFFSDPVIVRKGFRLGVRSSTEKSSDLSKTVTAIPRDFESNTLSSSQTTKTATTTTEPTITTTEPTTTATIKPTTKKSTPKILTTEPTTSTSEHTVSISDSTTFRTEPSNATTDPTTTTTDPTTTTTDPTTTTTDPKTTITDPTTATTDPTTTTTDPTTTTTDPTTITTDPTTIITDPTTTTTGPTTTTTDPTTTTTKPSRSKNDSTTSTIGSTTTTVSEPTTSTKEPTTTTSEPITTTTEPTTTFEPTTLTTEPTTSSTTEPKIFATEPTTPTTGSTTTTTKPKISTTEPTTPTTGSTKTTTTEPKTSTTEPTTTTSEPTTSTTNVTVTTAKPATTSTGTQWTEKNGAGETTTSKTTHEISNTSTTNQFITSPTAISARKTTSEPPLTSTSISELLTARTTSEPIIAIAATEQSANTTTNDPSIVTTTSKPSETITIKLPTKSYVTTGSSNTTMSTPKSTDVEETTIASTTGESKTTTTLFETTFNSDTSKPITMNTSNDPTTINSNTEPMAPSTVSTTTTAIMTEASTTDTADHSTTTTTATTTTSDLTTVSTTTKAINTEASTINTVDHSTTTTTATTTTSDLTTVSTTTKAINTEASTINTVDHSTTATTTSDMTTSTLTSTSENPACSGSPLVLFNQSGTIIYPSLSWETNYTSNTVCVWVIEGGPGKNISLNFIRLDIEEHPGCDYDYLEIHQISQLRGKALLGRFCGSTLPSNITSDGARLEVKFKSDRMVTGKGFYLEFNVFEVDSTFVDCPLGRTACRSSSLCIPTPWLCDGEVDCPWGDDEEQCDVCSGDQFSCSDSTCLSSQQVCDGTAQCPYGQDELDCVKTGEGQPLMLKREGVWLPVCASQGEGLSLDEPIAAWACDVTEQSLPVEVHRLPLTQPNTSFAKVIPSRNSSHDSGNSSLWPISLSTMDVVLSASCESNQVISVQCAKRECGIRGTQLPQPYVLGSTSSVDGQWPWMAAIFSGDDFLCGGILISPSWVVTAGHCVYNLINSPQTTTVVVGHVNIASPSVKHRRVTEIVMHPNNNFIYENDIALLRLSTEAEVSETVRPLCLPPKAKVRNLKTPCYVAGWGVRDKKKILVSELSPILQHAKVRLWNHSHCEHVYPDRIKASMICAGYQHGEVDACKGDSGGPLMCLSRPDQWELVGVVSWGEGCGLLGKPGVYTRVDSFLDWIQETTHLLGTKRANCDFEHATMCGYSGQSEGSFSWSRRVGGFHFPSRPMIDSSYRNISGHYAYAHIPYGQTGKTAHLLTPPIRNETIGPGLVCLHLYVIFYSCDQCTLEVLVIDSLGNQSAPLARFSDASLEKWMRAELDLPVDALSVQFSAYSGRYSGGGIGLDDVSLSFGQCSGLKVAQCEFDEVSNIDSFCGYRQDSSDDFDWLIMSDSSSDGFVRALIQTGSYGYKARLVSRPFKNEVSVCFKISFRISNMEHPGSLQVCKQMTYQGNHFLDCSIWTSDRHRSMGNWQTVQVSIPPVFMEYSLVLEASSGSLFGYIDVDSIQRRDGDCL